MAALDVLYGEGTSERLAAALPGEPGIVEVTASDGSVHVQATWADGSDMKIDCSVANVHYSALISKRQGLYTDLVATLPELFKSLGVVTFTASPADEKSKAILMKRGAWEEHPDLLRWRL